MSDSRTGEINAHRADTKGKIIFGNPDGTPFDKQQNFREENGFTTEGQEQIDAVNAEMTSADEQTAQGLGINAERLMQLDDMAALRDNLTQDELEDLYAANRR